MVVMNIGNKIKITLFICFFNLNIFAQECFCYKNVLFKEINSLTIVLDDYIPNHAIDKSIILVDYKKSDSLNVFRILETLDVLELFYKKPDCFLKYAEKMIYVYTENYALRKDSIFLEQVFQETLKSLKLTNAKTIVSWKNDSIIFLKNIPVNATIFDPIPIEYRIKDTIILKKEIYYDMIYPEIEEPKGIIFNLRKKDYSN